MTAACRRIEMRIRAATETDTEEWLQLRAALWPESSSAQHLSEIRAILSTPDEAAAFVCEGPDGALLGIAEAALRKWAEGCSSSPVGYLEGWYVRESARGRGIGAQLVRAAEEWARARGCSEMASDTDLGNAESEAAHRGLGYDVVAKVLCFRKPLAQPLS
jgi:aminoglycoside 6'-N-acetyltransferase I